jgi:hypothetical protein
MAGEQEISWVVQTHEHREHSTDWYWGLGVAATVGAGISIFFGNALLALIIGIGAVSIGVLVARGPREHSVTIDRRGMSVDGTLYRWSAIHSFWVEHEAERPHLYVSTTGVVTPRFSFPLESGSQGEQLRNFMAQFAPEEEQGPHFGEHLAQLFGL